MYSKLNKAQMKELVRDNNDLGGTPIKNLPQWNLNDQKINRGPEMVRRRMHQIRNRF